MHTQAFVAFYGPARAATTGILLALYPQRALMRIAMTHRSPHWLGMLCAGVL
jgi:hypothetical protein